jgi:L-lysine exporter family protein LysE/ArgO
MEATLYQFLQGFSLQASLILALGAQNIFVLNSGLKKQRHLLVAFVSSVCDTLLVFVGVLGVATFFVEFPVLKIGLGIIGVVFLFFYGVLKIKEGLDGDSRP